MNAIPSHGGVATIQCAYCDRTWQIYRNRGAPHYRCPYCDLYNGTDAAKKHGRWVEEPYLYFEIGPDSIRKCPQCGYAWKSRAVRHLPYIQCNVCAKEGRRCNFPAVYLDESGRVIS